MSASPTVTTPEPGDQASAASLALGDRVKALIDLAKDALALVRDVAILVLLLGLLFLPRTLNGVLKKAGISQIDVAGVQWSAVEDAARKSAAAGSETSAASASVQQARAVLQHIADTSKDPGAVKSANLALGDIDGSITTLAQASSSIASSYLNQQTVLQSAPTSVTAPAAPLEGWIYLGEVDRSMQHWVKPPAPKIDNPTPAIKSGDTITINDDLFVRADKTAGQIFNQAATLGAIRRGTTAQVEEVRPSPARNGGYFLWVKVKVLQAA